MKTEFLDGRTSIVTLYETLTEEHFIFEVKTDANGAVTGLFFTHHDSAKLARRFSTVFVMDATYKTNRYGMPLLNIVGVTATYSSFNAGFAFLREERGIWLGFTSVFKGYSAEGYHH
ncbi:hypothetical protein PsorP6_015351 [Peronosclerospora sorghi]|uniref:Uncharacterized protein n=1 Tax=Peronosclerospora sorghi TaxID=230839 RepID=A0ACC0WLY4_9STRA|nr:hypothetical protein PsorP6_015351 [Peronosclerospora sorghi]